MNAEQKQQAKQLIADWTNVSKTSTPAVWFLNGDCMAGFLQELIDAPAPEPVARVTGYYAGYLSIATVDGRVLPAGTALYAAPPHQSEHHLEMVNTPAPSVPDGLHLLISGAIYDFAGFLTTQEKTIQVGARVDASAVVDMLKEWAALRGLKLDDAAVLSWQEWLSPTPPEPPADVARDAARLDWLDERNAPHGLGWEIIQMPAGNVYIHTLTGDKAKFGSIREAIDAAIERQGG